MEPVERAGLEAETVGHMVRQEGSLDPVYASLESAIRDFTASGGSLDDVLPGGDEEALGFRRDKPNGRDFWRRYADVLRSELCTDGADLNTQVTQGVATSGATLVTVIIATLGLPLVAAPVIAPIAGAILGLGVKAICGNPDPD